MEKFTKGNNQLGIYCCWHGKASQQGYSTMSWLVVWMRWTEAAIRRFFLQKQQSTGCLLWLNEVVLVTAVL